MACISADDLAPRSNRIFDRQRTVRISGEDDWPLEEKQIIDNDVTRDFSSIRFVSAEILAIADGKADGLGATLTRCPGSSVRPSLFGRI